MPKPASGNVSITLAVPKSLRDTFDELYPDLRVVFIRRALQLAIDSERYFDFTMFKRKIDTDFLSELDNFDKKVLI